MAPCYRAAADTLDTVRADLLDLALLVIAVAFAVSGYRQGFIVGSLSFIGFVGGAVLGAEFGPSIARAIVGGQTQQDVVAVVLLIVFAIVGQFVFSSVGAYVRQSMTSPSSTVLDAVGGSLVSVLSMLLIAWAIGSVLTASSFQGVVTQVDNSVVLGTMDKIMPSQAKTMFTEFRQLLARGPFPQVFSGIGAQHLFAISAPDPAVLNSPGYLAATSRVLKVQGTALSCDRSIEGSAFVFAPQHILTNAHVVAGVDQGLTVTTKGGTVYHDAKVVLYDPQVDIAVLYVPGLDMTPLHFDYQGQAGANAVVAGYPRGSGLHPGARAHRRDAERRRPRHLPDRAGEPADLRDQGQRRARQLRRTAAQPVWHRVRRGVRGGGRRIGYRVRAHRERGRRRRAGRRQPDLPDFHPGL